MRVEPRGDDRLGPPRDPPRHADRFPAGGRAVVHRGIGDFAAEQPRDLALEFEQHLERALRDFGLVGRVSGEELAALDEVVDAGGDVMLVRAAAEEEGHFARDHILAREGAEMAFDRHFAGMHRQPMDRPVEPRFLGHVGEQIVDRGGPDRGEHFRAIAFAQRQVTHQLGFLMMKRRRT